MIQKLFCICSYCVPYVYFIPYMYGMFFCTIRIWLYRTGIYGGPIGRAMSLFSRNDLYATISSFCMTVANINAVVANIYVSVANFYVSSARGATCPRRPDLYLYHL